MQGLRHTWLDILKHEVGIKRDVLIGSDEEGLGDARGAEMHSEHVIVYMFCDIFQDYGEACDPHQTTILSAEAHFFCWKLHSLYYNGQQTEVLTDFIKSGMISLVHQI